MDTKQDSKCCGVCGDKALGYNFNAVTCESCKAFFRRNALLTKKFRCPFNDNCEITTITRRFCQKCRLEKCFSIGMRKDYIMTEEDKQRKRKITERNKVLKRSMGAFKQGFKKMKKDSFSEDSQDYEDSTASEPQILPSPGDYTDYSSPEGSDLQIDNVIKTMFEPATNIKPISTNNSNIKSSQINNNSVICNKNLSTETVSDTTTKDILEDVQRIPIEPNSIESILCEAIKLEYAAGICIAQSTSNSRELNDAERAKLNELIVANKALLTPVDDDLTSLIAEDCRFMTSDQALLSDPALVDVINLTAIAIRRLIKMAKKINAFKNMCQEDQIALLKGGCTEMMILRSTMNYDSSHQSWRIPHTRKSFSSLKADILKKAKGNIYEVHERFMNTFDAKWRNDENIVLILCAISLFTPDRPRIVHQDVIKLEQNSYYYLLRRYLESVYPGCEAKSTFLKLIQKIAELHRVNEEVINCYLDVNPSDVEPLLIEIFDLKH